MTLIPTDIWTVSPEEKARHERLFQSMAPLQGKISGDKAKKEFMKSNLPTPVLGQIWTLSDLDRDGRMTLQEFMIAMHLLSCKIKGVEIPRSLPPSLKSSTDPSQQAFPVNNMSPMGNMPGMNQMGNNMMGMQGGMGMTPSPGMSPMRMNNSMGMSPGMSPGMSQNHMGMNPNMGMSPNNMGMNPNMRMQQMGGPMPMQGMQQMQPMNAGGMGFNAGMNNNTGFMANPGQINRVTSLPANSHAFGGQQQQKPGSSFTLPHNKSNASSVFSSSQSGFVNPVQPQSTNALDSLSLEGLSGFSKAGPGGGTASPPTLSLGNISAPSRMRYTQMFKAADNGMTGFLEGEQARQLLIQSNISPQALAQIWELSDINKDGRLELDEFIIAMHLIDLFKAGIALPPTLPNDIIPAKFRKVNLGRSDSTASTGSQGRGSNDDPLVSFEERRRMNWSKGQAELERRRRELQERNQREREERERKEREEEERKRMAREEAERKRQQELENARRQKEEMEREQEALRKKMIEDRLAAQLEAEKKRQQEWEKRRKEELLNQKGLEENIVNELKTRLTKLKTELASQTSERDSMSSKWEAKKSEGRELHAAIEDLNKRRDQRMKDITKLQSELSQNQAELNQYINERQRYTMELNNDSTTTSEALGALKSSVQQMKLDITRLKKNLISIESEAVVVLKEANQMNAQHMEIKALLAQRMNENKAVKQAKATAKISYDHKQKRLAAQRQKQEEVKRKQKEQEAKEQARQKEEAQKREAIKQQAEQVLKKQQNLLKSKEAKQEQPNVTKVPPQRPRSRPQASPSKEPFNMNLDSNKFESSTATSQPQSQGFVADFGSNFGADFGSLDLNAPENKKTSPVPSKQPNLALTADLNAAFESKASKKPPPRPAAPSAGPPRPAAPSKDAKKDAKKNTDDKKKAQEAEAQRLLKEKQEIERLKREEDERKRKEKEKAGKQRREEEERQRKEREKQEQKDREKRDKEEEKRRKEAEVKRRVEEMQRKKMQKKQADTVKQPLPETPVARAASPPTVVQEYVKKSMFKMIFPFEARNPDELDLTEGDLVQVDEKDTSPPPGWLRGTCKGMSGLFPANYASKLQDTVDDYVDLDPASNVAQELSSQTQQPQQQVPKPRPQASKPIETKAEPIPKLRPVAKPTNTAKPEPQRPKSALLPPTGPLKPLQPLAEAPIKQTKTAESNPIPSYEYVSGPPREAEPSTPMEDFYAVPVKDTSSKPKEKERPTSPFKDAIEEDLYQVPGQLMSSGEATNTSATSNGGAADTFEAVALYPYHGTQDDHLSFGKNDVINVLQKEDPWWMGEFNGKSGWFPNSYVKPIGQSKPRSSSQSSSLTAHSMDEPNKIQQQQPIPEAQPTVECVALFDYAGQDGDLTFHEGDVITLLKQEADSEWWQGSLNGQEGMFPANYVEVRETPAARPQHLEIVDSAEPPAAVPVPGEHFAQATAEKPEKPEVATVVSKYVAEGSSEINLNVGQLVHVMLKNPDGWWQGELQVRGKNKPNGWFPGNHVKLMTKTKNEPSTPSMPRTPTTEKTPEIDAAGSQAIQEDIYSVPVKRKDKEEQVLAMFSYTAQNEDELTFYKGSVIHVISKDGEWWKGELNGEIGVFPFNYVQILRNENEVTSQWSGAFDISLLKSMTNTERQRQNHIYELINTEQDYMNDLSLTLEVFYNPIAEANMLSEQELNTVFVNWKELIMCNMKFLKALIVRRKMSETDKIEGIGDILLEQLPRFWPYIRFCSCMLNACRLLQDKVEKDADFKTFEKKCAGDPRLNQNLPLSSYLLKPLQRITKYPLLISGILKYTPEDYYDRENLETALEKSEDICSQVNEGVRSQENSNRLEWLQERVNLEGLEERLAFNSSTNCLGQRKYMYHGNLHKHKSNKELKAFLFNDFLLLCKVHTPSKLPLGIFHPDCDIKLSIYKKPIFLNEVIVKRPQDAEVNETLFHLSHIDRVISFRAESKNDRNSWVTNIQQASQQFIETERDKRNRATRARSLGDNEVGRLVVTIIEGADLQPSDPNGTSDPYCEVSMGSQEHRTKVIPKDLNPKWNSTMVFNIKDLDKDVLCITVFDRDFFSPNDFLGRTEVSIASIMKHSGPITKRLLLHEVSTGELVVTLELQNIKML
ncbi:intersectin-1-like isoform X2 [Clytia hemisphaerica]|uniref:Intersectin-1-like n=1 Tax=Clytia hemisphaerica TaxID=252671 RepID=A0A7M5V2A7_9CNID